MRRLRTLAVRASLAISIAAACGGDFDPGSRVTKLRVLAIRSDRPFTRPGERIALEPLVVDPAARPLTYGYALCRDPRSSSVLECLAAADPTPLYIGPQPNFGLDVPDARSLGLVVAACPGPLRYAPTLPLPFVCESEGHTLSLEDFELGVKRIFVRARDRNENPSITRVTWDDMDWPQGEAREVSRCDEDTNDFSECPESIAHRLSVVTSPAESGVDETGATFRERQIIQYYASEGIFEFDVKSAEVPETRWLARKSTPTEVRVWFVVRDDRGGVTWTERRVLVR